MRLLCPAKINLHLRVGSLRADRFHPLLSWFCTTGLFDTLTIERDPAPEVDLGSDSAALVKLTCDAPDLPCDRRNLVVKVGDAFGEEMRRPGRGSVFAVRVHLSKRIPAGAGLGGGSSDGAHMLMGLDRLWGVGLAPDALSTFAARFGSDLSFFFHGASSVCSGRGELVRPSPRPRPRWVALILPPIVMPTGDVYRQFDAMGLGRQEDVAREPDWLAWSELGAKELLAQLVNDLEPPAFALSPELADLRASIERALGRAVRMSGSGSSLFTLFDEQDEAAAIKESLAAFKVRVELAPLAPDLQQPTTGTDSTAIK